MHEDTLSRIPSVSTSDRDGGDYREGRLVLPLRLTKTVEKAITSSALFQAVEKGLCSWGGLG